MINPEELFHEDPSEKLGDLELGFFEKDNSTNYIENKP